MLAAFALSAVIHSVTAQPPSEALPQCLSSPDQIADIQRAQTTNAKTPHKYDGYRKVFQENSDRELAVRLAYAETLAANCPDQTAQVLAVVTSVIGNRIRIRGGDVRSVVFQRDQFASSLNIYPESRYREFLCPQDEQLWRKVDAAMRENLASPIPGASMPGDAVNYYLYRHSRRFSAPDWGLDEVVTADRGVSDCIRVFRNPAWR